MDSEETTCTDAALAGVGDGEAVSFELQEKFNSRLVETSCGLRRIMTDSLQANSYSLATLS